MGKQAAVVACLLARPYKRRTGTAPLQKTQTPRRAGFQGAADAAAVAGLSLGGLERTQAVKMNDLFCHQRNNP